MAHTVQQGLNLLAEHLPPLLANHQGAEVNQRFEQLETRLDERFGQLMAAINQTNQAINQTNQALNMTNALNKTNQALNKTNQTLNQGFADLRAAIEYHNQLAHARSLNSCAVADTARLRPVPLPNGEYPTPGVFPGTVNDFWQLDEPELMALLQLYELPEPNLLAEKRRSLAVYFGVPQ
ncbi:hypothetical protein OPQ81_009162 [Rhizoctonia solani]|nr:hypothetical protein OPQ81_009162 [Rhizoctonia solani]